MLSAPMPSLLSVADAKYGGKSIDNSGEVHIGGMAKWCIACAFPWTECRVLLTKWRYVGDIDNNGEVNFDRARRIAARPTGPTRLGVVASLPARLRGPDNMDAGRPSRLGLRCVDLPVVNGRRPTHGNYHDL